jgi:hypothetical protein
MSVEQILLKEIEVSQKALNGPIDDTIYRTMLSDDLSELVLFANDDKVYSSMRVKTQVTG